MDAQADLRVAWLGPDAHGLGWLLQRVASHRAVDRHVSISLMQKNITLECLQSLVGQGVDRIILSCRDRISYPVEAIDWLSCHSPDTPFALAVDSWWQGARRTGLGATGHVMLPWHRWWDGWADWLDGHLAEMFGPCVEPATYHGRGCPVGPLSRPVCGLIIANCQNTARAWQQCAESLGAEARVVSLRVFLSEAASWRGHVGPASANQLSASQEPVFCDWLLWDDSCLDTAIDCDEARASENFFSTAARLFPDALLCAAYSIPRWHSWKHACQAGAQELLTKPNTGRALERILRSYFSGRSD